MGPSAPWAEGGIRWSVVADGVFALPLGGSMSVGHAMEAWVMATNNGETNKVELQMGF